MKKVLCTIALMLLIAGSAYAQATFSLTGDYWAEGKYWFNYNSGPGTDATYSERSFGFYEQDINLYPKISVGDTSLNFRVAITDVYWGGPNSDGSELITQGADDPNANDDNIQIERAFLTHKFGDKLTLDVGLMDGTQWGTVFADDKQPQWRIKAIATTSVGAIGAVLEKNVENGALGRAANNEEPAYAGEDERADRDSYGLFMITKVGDIYVKPLLWYVDSMRDETGFTLFNPVLALNGDLGAFSFETEINYKMWNAQVEALDFDEDANVLGFYLNIWKALDAMTPGFVFAYGGYDKDFVEDNIAIGGNFASFGNFDFEDDFNSTVILGDEYCWGGGGDDLQGMTLLKLYVNDIKTGIDPLTLSAYAAYVMSNQEGQIFDGGAVVDNPFEDATAWEFGLGAAYKITDNLTYSVYGAYADINYDVTGVDDPDAVYMIANAIEFNF